MFYGGGMAELVDAEALHTFGNSIPVSVQVRLPLPNTKATYINRLLLLTQ